MCHVRWYVCTNEKFSNECHVCVRLKVNCSRRKRRRRRHRCRIDKLTFSWCIKYYCAQCAPSMHECIILYVIIIYVIGRQSNQSAELWLMSATHIHTHTQCTNRIIERTSYICTPFEFNFQCCCEMFRNNQLIYLTKRAVPLLDLRKSLPTFWSIWKWIRIYSNSNREIKSIPRY